MERNTACVAWVRFKEIRIKSFLIISNVLSRSIQLEVSAYEASNDPKVKD